MKGQRLLIVTAIFIVLIVLMGVFIPRNTSAENYGSLAETATQLAIIPNNPTPVELTQTPEVRQQYLPVIQQVSPEETATNALLEPTFDPNLFADMPLTPIRVDAKVLPFNKMLNVVVQNNDFAEGAVITGTVLQGSLENAPLLEGLGPPCTVGNYSWITGYVFDTQVKYGQHNGTDIYCSDKLFASPTKGIVYSVLWDDNENFKYLTSGKNVMVVAKIPQGTQMGDQEMSGYLLFGGGHLEPGINVEVGQIVEPGQQLGTIGLTGKTTGLHIHYYVVWIKPDGSMEFLNPEDWNAVGSR